MYEQFGRYILEERIAIGGMAEIFRAKAPGLGGFEKIVAIKRLHPRYSQDADFIEMLIDEARITVELNHSNIGQIFDLGKVDDHYFIAMEFIDGRDLYRVMRRLRERVRILPFDLAAYITMQCAAGLDYAHRKLDARGEPLHIIHRDVSPQNVLLTYEGDVKLVDFGIAKAALRAYQTESGIIKGKFYYMSPEQAKGEVLDHRTDVFSLGIVLYEMLTGELLYKDDDEATLLGRVRRAEIERPSVLRTDLPADLEQIVMGALARDRNLRYPSAGHLQQDLSNWLQDSSGMLSRQRLAALMRELYEPAVHPLPEVVISDRDDFEVDEHSIISEALFIEEDETRIEDEVASTQMGAAVGGPGAAVPQDNVLSGLLEIDAEDFELLDESSAFMSVGSMDIQAVDSIEVAPYDDGSFLGDDEDPTRTFDHGPVDPQRSRAPVAAAQAMPPQPAAQAIPQPAPQMPQVAPQPVPQMPQPVPQMPQPAPQMAQPAPQPVPQMPQPVAQAMPQPVPQYARGAAAPAARAPAEVRGAQRPARGGAGDDLDFNHQPTKLLTGRDNPVGRRIAESSKVGLAPYHELVHPPGAVETPPGYHQTGAIKQGWMSRERIWMGIFLVSVIVVAAAITSLFTGKSSTPPKNVSPLAVSLNTGGGAAAPASAAVASQAQPAVATQGRGSLTLSSFPSGAAIRIDGKWQAHLSTPATLELPTGSSVAVRIQLEGYEAFDEQVLIRAEQPSEVHAALKRVQGVLTIESKPSGALVRIGEREVGRTPLTVSDLPMDGPATLVVSKDGFEPYEHRVDWSRGREQLLEPQLRPVEVAPVAVAPPVQAQAPPKKAPARRTARRAAPQRTARRAAPAAQSEDLPPIRRGGGSPARSQPAPAKRASGHGMISVKPMRGWGSVYVDGQMVAQESPLIGHRLPAGVHQVRLCYNGDRSRCTADRRVTIRAGGHERVVF